MLLLEIQKMMGNGAEGHKSEKELIVFDLDGTLAISKSNLDSEMAGLLAELLAKKRVAIVSGCSYGQFEKQFLQHLTSDNLERLSLFPTCGTRFFKFGNGNWSVVYEKVLSKQVKKKIFGAFESMFQEIGYKHPEKLYGEVIEDRGSQITFSAHGQEAPVSVKENWDPKGERRVAMANVMQKYIPEFAIRVGGTTSIDVTMKGIDKKYAIEKMEEYLHVTRDKMLFIGDALFPGGNDYPVNEAGVECIQVSDVEETKRIVRGLIED